MLAHKLQVDVPQDHKLSLDLPESFPAGPAEIIVLATPREQRKIVRAAGVLGPEGTVPEGEPIAEILQEVRAERAESIERFGVGTKPVPRLVPAVEQKPRRVLGQDAGLFEVPDDFDAPLPEDVLTSFGL